MNNESIESNALTINLLTKHLMRYFDIPAVYNRIGYALSSGNEQVGKLLDSIEKTYNRINELCLCFNYKRASHFVLVLKYLINQLKKEIATVKIEGVKY